MYGSFLILPITVLWQVLVWGLPEDYDWPIFWILFLVLSMELFFPLIILFSLTTGEKPRKLQLQYTEYIWELLVQYYRERRYTSILEESESKIEIDIAQSMTVQGVTLSHDGETILLDVPDNLCKHVCTFLNTQDLEVLVLE